MNNNQNNEDLSTILNMLSSNSTTISSVPIENLIILTNSILKKIKKINESNENLRNLNFKLKALIMAIKTYKLDDKNNNNLLKKEEIIQSIENIESTINNLKIEDSNNKEDNKEDNKELSKKEIFEIIKSHLGSDKTLENNFLFRIVNVLSEDFMSINDIMKKSGVAKFRVAEILNKCSKKEGLVHISKSKMNDGTVGFNLKIN